MKKHLLVSASIITLIFTLSSCQTKEQSHKMGEQLTVIKQANDIPSQIIRENNETVVVNLETKELTAEIKDGISYEYWTYNGTVPGPMIRAKEGDTVQVNLTHSGEGHHEMAFNFIPTTYADGDDHEEESISHENKSEHEQAGHGKHSIDLHAVVFPGGGATVTQTDTGDISTFEFKATHPGLYIYHCASPHVPSHIANGMYGMILVEPEEGLSEVDKEFYIMQGELYTEGVLNEPGLKAFSLDKLLNENPEYYVFNGAVNALTGDNSMRVKMGEKVRLFFGVGTFKPSSLHLIGGIFENAYIEGDLVSKPHKNIQTTLVPAGGAVMVEFTIDVPGKYLLVDHTLTRSIDRGALAEIVVE